MRGILHAQDDKNKTANATTTCVNITHSPSLTTLTDWDSEEDNSQHSTANINTTIVYQDSNSTEESKEREPPIVDCCTEVDYSRRVEIAKSAGFIYDEVTGVESILQSLTLHELKYLADR